MTSMGFTSTYQMVFRDLRVGENGLIQVIMALQAAEQMVNYLGGFSMQLDRGNTGLK